MENHMSDNYDQLPKKDPLNVDPDDVLRELSASTTTNTLDINQIKNLCEQLSVAVYNEIVLIENKIASYDQAIQKLTQSRDELEEYRKRFTGMYELIKRRE